MTKETSIKKAVALCKSLATMIEKSKKSRKMVSKSDYTEYTQKQVWLDEDMADTLRKLAESLESEVTNETVQL